jgi:hypothetical protein
VAGSRGIQMARRALHGVGCLLLVVATTASVVVFDSQALAGSNTGYINCYLAKRAATNIVVGDNNGVSDVFVSRAP